MEEQVFKRTPVFKKATTLFQYDLTSKQNIYSHYIIPSTISLTVYVLHFVADIVLSYQHYRAEDPFYASLTLFWMFVPAISCFFLTVINLDLWPQEETCGSKSVKWFFIRFFQHLLFPVWAMYRYAEQLFWRIEALRANDEIERAELLHKSERRSIFSLYHFLQAYFQCAPQILFQINIILKHPSDFNKDTVDLQVMSIALSLIRMAITTTSYQRFGTQKLAGRQYPWDKIKQKQYKARLLQDYASDTEEPSPKLTRRDSGLSTTSSQFEAEIQKQKIPHSEPVRIDSVHGLASDDAAGKFVANLWWLCFILPRMSTLAIFTYFYVREAISACFLQYAVVLILLLRYSTWSDPDNKNKTSRRTKYPINNENVQKFSFHLITSYIYLFCLIEFKTRFTKVKVVYNWYFIIIYLQNIVMMMLWYYHAETYEIWWFNYALYLNIGSSILSVLSMAMYLSKLKPQKRIAHKIFRNSKL